eukprot:scaffold31844_cov17-Prasinocladus_malaysianus.AAC.1
MAEEQRSTQVVGTMRSSSLCRLHGNVHDAADQINKRQIALMGGPINNLAASRHLSSTHGWHCRCRNLVGADHCQTIPLPHNSPCLTRRSW